MVKGAGGSCRSPNCIPSTYTEARNYQQLVSYDLVYFPGVCEQLCKWYVNIYIGKSVMTNMVCIDIVSLVLSFSFIKEQVSLIPVILHESICSLCYHYV